VGTNTLEKKNKDLNRATKELEAKMRNLQQRTESEKGEKKEHL
jgi:molecular chaperone GrpE (heat shock protein)